MNGHVSILIVCVNSFAMKANFRNAEVGKLRTVVRLRKALVDVHIGSSAALAWLVDCHLVVGRRSDPYRAQYLADRHCRTWLDCEDVNTIGSLQ